MPDEPQQTGSEEAAAPPADADRSSVETLLDEAQSALSSLNEPVAELPPGVKPFELSDLFCATP
jgi:hypothetical protein